MRVLLLGATGSIGTVVMNELIRNGHVVLGLARSPQAEQAVSQSGAQVVSGDLRQPEQWASAIRQVDAVVHVAATFSADMGAVDRAVIDALTDQAKQSGRRIRFVYTGGTWLYGNTADTVATEATPFDPIQSFAWMIENGQAVMNAGCFDGLMVHPAMVYDRDGGVFSRFLSSAQSKGRVEVWGRLETRWPLVHRHDLAAAYLLVLEAGRPGEAYNVAAQQGVRVGEIANAIGRRLGLDSEPLVRSVDDVVEEFGDWAVGPILDQQMSADKIVRELGWVPHHLDAIAEIS